jgi:hypothetical protein
MYNSVMTESNSKPKTKNVTTIIKVDDYKFLKENNLHVSDALSIGVRTLRKLFETGIFPYDPFKPK